MPKGENQKLKLLYISKLLLELTDEEHKLSTAELIKRLADFGVSAERKSIYSDIEALIDYGLDIEHEAGKTGGYYIASRDFELPELKLLVDAVQSSKFITQKKSRELIEKLEGLASKSQAAQLKRQVYIDNRLKTMNERIYYSVDKLHTAISQEVKVNFRYYEWNEKKEKVYRHDGGVYSVSPAALCWDDENYYLIGVDSVSGIVKHYRVDKMDSLELTEEKAEKPEIIKDMDAGMYARRTFAMFAGHEEIVVLDCANQMAGIIIDRFGEDISFRYHNKERFEVSVKVNVSSHFLTWLMNFGGNVTIVSPQNVIDEYHAIAEKAINN